MFDFNLKNISLTAVAGAALMAGSASAQEACTNYTVQDGDTLATISITAYGTSNYQPIFNANRNAIDNPGQLAPGLVLALPCEDGSLPNGQSAQELIAEQEERAAANRVSNVYAPPIKMVTGSNWTPFADDSLNGGGIFPRIASTALNRAGNQREYSVSFVNDWTAHLQTLLPLGAFDVSLAWNIPDCSNTTYEWSEETTYRCTQFNATVSVYDTVVGFVSLPDSEYASARTYDDLKGATICRMKGWFTSDLEEQGLGEPAITLLRPITARECLDAVLTGTADMASFELESIAAEMSGMGLTGQDLVENPNVTTMSTLRFITHKSNPYGRQYMAMFNRGLNEMRESGEWYAIISDSLNEQNQKNNAETN